MRLRAWAPLAAFAAGAIVPAAAVGEAAARCDGRVATLVGTPGDDRVIGTRGPDVISTLTGDDVVHGAGGDDRVCAGPGVDRVVGGGGDDRLHGGRGDDRVRDGEGLHDALRGGRGDDVVVSTQWSMGLGSFAKHLFGGPGADELRTYGSDEDRLYGGPGPDVLTARSVTESSQTDALDGGPGADRLDGNQRGFTVFDLTGDGDTVVLRAVPTRTHSEVKAVLSYRAARGPVQVDLLEGTGRVVGSPVGDTIAGQLRPELFEVWLFGGPYADLLAGRDGRDHLAGFAGDDLLLGRGDVDSLTGHGGDDRLDGGDGADDADGRIGADTCIAVEVTKSCTTVAGPGRRP